MTFQEWAQRRLLQVEQELHTLLPAPDSMELAEAMRYAVLDGGKRLRPLLVLAAGECCGLQAESGSALMRAACAVEFIHAYSLVHDDMPCMDNDLLRRGKPTVHVRFGQAQALLVGDALQSLAFESLAPLGPSDAADALVQARCTALLAHASGARGMAGGQAVDLLHVGRSMNESQLLRMHGMKTGALLTCCVDLGVTCAAGVPEGLTEALHGFARNLGLAFQVVDDVLDVTSSAQTLGKTAGKDVQDDKPTYVTVLGLEAARARARDLHSAALAALDQAQSQRVAGVPAQTDTLRAIMHWVIERDH